MANEIKLEFYIFRIRERSTKVYIALDDFFEQHDFFYFFEKYINAFDKQLLVNEKQKKSLQFQSDSLSINSAKRMMSGIIESGDYGTEEKIVHITSGKHKYTKQSDETGIKPFYFLLSAPRKHDKGLLVLQRLGIYGINNVFCHHLSEYFKVEYQHFMVEFSPFVSKDLAKAFVERGNIRELTLRRYNLPSDVIDKLGLAQHQEDILSIELTIKARQKRALELNDRVKKFINNPNAKLFDTPELKGLGFNGEHESKMKVKLGKNTRTVDLTESGQLRPYYDIDNVVEKHETGHPVFDSIDEIAKEHLDDLYNEIYS